MLAIALHEHGGPEVLQAVDLPDPEPESGQVRVRVHAAAVNRLDLWVRYGLGHDLPKPHVLGADAAGVIDAVGPDVDRAMVGREVVLNPGVSCGHCAECLGGEDNLCLGYSILGETRAGVYAEAVVVPLQNVVDKPARLGMVEAAAFPLVFLTAWQMLHTRARVQPGETVLIHAVGSGVGSAALQIAKHAGARTIGLASTDAKLGQARAMGCDFTFRSDDGSPDWYREVRSLPFVGRRGVDVVFEHVGQATWERSIKIARRGGRVVTCGASSGHAATTDLRQVFFRQVQILGSTMASKQALHTIADLMQRGAFEPVVDRVFALREAADAHRYLDRREQFGKVVLQVR